MPRASRWSTAGRNGRTGSCCWSDRRAPARATSPPIWAEQAGARSISAHALTAAAVPGALATGALVVEDLNSPDFDERALFHLMNLAREDEAFVLITARVPPSASQIELRDLRSRLRAVPTVSLLPPDDATVSRADRQILRRPSTGHRRDRGELSGNPDRAVLCGGKAGGRAAGRRGLAAGPAGDPGAGGRIAAQCLIAGLPGHLDGGFGRNINVIETSSR